MPGKRILRRADRLASLGQSDRYLLVRLVAEDTFGQIWQSEDTSLRAPVTIRIVDESLTSDQARVDAFRGALNALYGRLAQPNIAWVYYYNGEDGPTEFVVMEELRGQTLAQRLGRGPGLRPLEGFSIAAAIAQGLHAAHEAGVAHGALTADSVMLTAEGSVKIMDFGLAELRPQEEPGSRGPAGDVRSLGTLLREMSGARSAEGTPGRVPSRPGIDVEVLRLWQASLDPDPAARPPAEDLAAAFGETAERETDRAVQPAKAAEVSIPESVVPAEPARLPQVDEPPLREPTPIEPATSASPEAVEDPTDLTEESRRAEEARKAKEARKAEEVRAFREAAREASRLAKAARREERAAGAETLRRAEHLERAEEAVRRLEESSKEAADRARNEAARLDWAREALERAETEHTDLTKALTRAEEIAVREDQQRKEAILRAEEAARRAEAARAAAAAARRLKTGAEEEVRKTGESTQVVNVRTEETAERVAGATQQRDEARKASQGARARHARLAKAAREAEEAARRSESRAGRVPKTPNAGRGGDQPKLRSGAAGGPGRTVAPATGPARSDSWHTNVEPSWRRALPHGRRWLGLLGLTLATALLVFLLARPDAEPASENRSGGSAESIAGGPQSLVMPDLRGLTYDEALIRLEEMGLVLGRRVRAQGEPAVVVATDPGLGQLVPKGTQVTVFVGADAASGETALADY